MVGHHAIYNSCNSGWDLTTPCFSSSSRRPDHLATSTLLLMQTGSRSPVEVQSQSGPNPAFVPRCKNVVCPTVRKTTMPRIARTNAIPTKSPSLGGGHGHFIGGWIARLHRPQRVLTSIKPSMVKDLLPVTVLGLRMPTFGFVSRLRGSKNPHFSDFGHGQMVPRKGLEPSRPLSHWHLKPARLPIPPPGPGRVSKDRSRACQIASMPAKYAVQRRRVGVSRIR